MGNTIRGQGDGDDVNAGSVSSDAVPALRRRLTAHLATSLLASWAAVAACGGSTSQQDAGSSASSQGGASGGGEGGGEPASAAGADAASAGSAGTPDHGTGGEAGTGGAASTVAGTGGATEPPEPLPTCEQMYDGSQAHCGATPAYPSDRCTSPYENGAVDFDDDKLGYTAYDLLEALNTPGVGTLTWFDEQTTKIRISADPDVVFAGDSRTFVRRDAAPPNQGYCYRSLSIELRDPLLRVTTDDGRLDWALKGKIIGIDHGCGLESVLARVEIVADLSFDVPAEWDVEGQEEVYIGFKPSFPVNRCSPYCARSENYCGPEEWGGRLWYEPFVLDENDHGVDAGRHLLGSWDWDE